MTVKRPTRFSACFIALVAAVLLMIPAVASAARIAKTVPTILSPDVLGAKTLLEDMLVKRLSTELGTLVERERFTMSAQVELTQNETAEQNDFSEETENAYPPDLLLGKLDLDQMLKKYGERDFSGQNLLGKYRITAVTIGVGLRGDFDAGGRGVIEKWLKERVAAEFGQLGKASVNAVQDVPPKSPAPRSWPGWLSEYKEVVGQGVLGLFIVLAAVAAIVAWRLLTPSVRPKSDGDTASKLAALAAATSPPAERPQVESPAKAPGEEQEKGSRGRSPAEEGSITSEMQFIQRKLAQIIEKTKAPLDQLVASWCRTGEEGHLKSACFLEAVSTLDCEVALPRDAESVLAKAFQRMTEIGTAQKLDFLKKAYWDLITFRSLGGGALEQPFNYLGQYNASMLNRILIDKNPKMKVIVAVSMPQSFRERYLRSLDFASKRELLAEAFRMESVPTADVREFDGSLRAQVSGEQGPTDTFSIRPLLMKLVEPLEPHEEISILHGLAGELGARMSEFKRTYGSLAFIDEWPDEALKMLFWGASADEVVALLRTEPGFTEKVLAQCPPLTTEIVRDELARTKTMNAKTRADGLGILKSRLVHLTGEGRIDLSAIFPDKTATVESDDERLKAA
jgi:hypothetical protein